MDDKGAVLGGVLCVVAVYVLVIGLWWLLTVIGS